MNGLERNTILSRFLVKFIPLIGGQLLCPLPHLGARRFPVIFTVLVRTSEAEVIATTSAQCPMLDWRKSTAPASDDGYFETSDHAANNRNRMQGFRSMLNFNLQHPTCRCRTSGSVEVEEVSVFYRLSDRRFCLRVRVLLR